MDARDNRGDDGQIDVTFPLTLVTVTVTLPNLAQCGT